MWGSPGRSSVNSALAGARVSSVVDIRAMYAVLDALGIGTKVDARKRGCVVHKEA